MPNHVINIINAPENVINALCYQRSPAKLAEAEAERILEQAQFDKVWTDRVASDDPRIRDMAGNEPYQVPQVDPTDWFVDFGRVVPCDPEKVYTGDSCNRQHPHLKEDGTPYEDCWYNWNINHWGTKWNGYSVERPDPETLKFESAWSHPYPVIEALSRLFPEVEIEVAYADEDRGSNCGKYTIEAGLRTEPDDDPPADGGIESTRFAVELWGGDWASTVQEYAEYEAEEESPITTWRDLAKEMGLELTPPAVVTAEVKEGLL